MFTCASILEENYEHGENITVVCISQIAIGSRGREFFPLRVTPTLEAILGIVFKIFLGMRKNSSVLTKLLSDHVTMYCCNIVFNIKLDN